MGTPPGAPPTLDAPKAFRVMRFLVNDVGAWNFGLAPLAFLLAGFVTFMAVELFEETCSYAGCFEIAWVTAAIGGLVAGLAWTLFGATLASGLGALGRRGRARRLGRELRTRNLERGAAVTLPQMEAVRDAWERILAGRTEEQKDAATGRAMLVLGVLAVLAAAGTGLVAGVAGMFAFLGEGLESGLVALAVGASAVVFVADTVAAWRGFALRGREAERGLEWRIDEARQAERKAILGDAAPPRPVQAAASPYARLYEPALP